MELFREDGCLTDEGLQALVGGSLDEWGRLEAAEHLSYCDRCMDRYTALLTGGDFHLTTKKGVGTEICAVFVLSSIDRMPMGDLAGTVLLLVQANPKMDIRLDVRVNENSYSFDTREVRQVLGDDVPLDLPEVSAWMQENLTEGIEALHGGM